jgi:hypothetical protein
MPDSLGDLDETALTGGRRIGLVRAPAEQAGFEVACRVLDFLLSQGLRLRRGWEDSLQQETEVENQPRKLVHELVYESDRTAHFHSNSSTIRLVSD